MERIIVVDIGNTSVTVGLAIGPTVRRRTRVMTAAGTGRLIRRVLARIAGQRRVDGAVLCSVVPSATRLWEREMRQAFKCRPLIVSCRVNLGIGINYPAPRTIGADRLANASGAVARYGAPVIVADFGTALTFDVVSRDRAYIGGVIAPGPQVMMDYLAERTALLPRLSLPGRASRIGKTTLDAMAIGARVGYTGMVRALVGHLRRTFGPRVRFVATGGYVKWAVAGLGIPVDPDLTLYGLIRIYSLNAAERSRKERGLDACRRTRTR